jgi:hypothetical protein
MAFRVIQPYGSNRPREADELSSWSTLHEAFEEIDRYAARERMRHAPSDHLDLRVVDDDGYEILRPTN